MPSCQIARPSTRSSVPKVVEPGTRLVERYRLEQLLDGAAGGGRATYWRAEDELLARPVGVCLIDLGDTDDPRAAEVLTAARQAAALPDERFLRVLDASELDGHVYVVSEWVAATDLAGLVSDGPLPATEARTLAADLAAALSAAHDAGLTHQCLGPQHVLRTSHGQLKLAGLAVDAAAEGRSLADPSEAARRDVSGIGAVLYAALTSRWPGEQRTALAPAPLADDAVCTPRQVRAGIPHELDEIVCRALDLPGRRGAAFRTPAELLSALDSAGHTARLPVVSHVPVPPRRDDLRPGATAYDRADRDDAPDGRARSRAVVLAWVAAAIVLVTGLSLFGGQVMMTALDGGDDSSQATTGDDSGDDEDQGGTPVKRLDVAAVTAFDPSGDGEEHDELAPLAVDGDPSTAWTTMNYYDPINLLKDGVGLVIDLGAPAEVSDVVVSAAGGPTDFEVRVADRLPAALSGYQQFDRTSNATGRTAMRVEQPVRARYVLVWLTGLPKVGTNYVGEIAEVVVRGSAVDAS
jgi:hypothetical protein